MPEPKLHCPRCGAPARIELGFMFHEAEAEADVLGVVQELTFMAIAICGGGCGEPDLELPVDTNRYAFSGWVPPAAFDERSKAWYRESV